MSKRVQGKRVQKRPFPIVPALFGLLLLAVVGLLFFYPRLSPGPELQAPPVSAPAETPPAPPTEEQEVYLDPALIPEKLFEVLEKNPETFEYVRQYPELHDQHPAIDLSAEAASGTVPLLIQWDPRWGYEPYGDGLIGYTACAPTCISMVALYLTRNPEYTPLAVARTAEAEGYYAEGSGTPWVFLYEGCTLFGLTARQLSLSEAEMKTALDQGCPIICSVAPGDFTPTGHYIVVSGWNEEGFIVRDPNSRLRSQRTWTFEELSWQIRNLWAYQTQEAENAQGEAQDSDG